MRENKIYKDSIILIGPSGAGKSTVAEELSKKTGLPRLCIDKIENHYRGTGFMRKFRNSDEFNAYMLLEELKRAEEIGQAGVVDLGAGHSVYRDQNIFNSIKKAFSSFENVVLLLPSVNVMESLKIMNDRAIGDTRENLFFLTSPCNCELATMTVYTNDKNVEQIAYEILERIKKKSERDSFENEK